MARTTSRAMSRMLTMPGTLARGCDTRRGHATATRADHPDFVSLWGAQAPTTDTKSFECGPSVRGDGVGSRPRAADQARAVLERRVSARAARRRRAGSDPPHA